MRRRAHAKLDFHECSTLDDFSLWHSGRPLWLAIEMATFACRVPILYELITLAFLCQLPGGEFPCFSIWIWITPSCLPRSSSKARRPWPMQSHPHSPSINYSIMVKPGPAEREYVLSHWRLCFRTHAHLSIRLARMGSRNHRIVWHWTGGKHLPHRPQ